jgi:hypothetical protein
MTRKRYIQDPVTLKLVPAEEYYQRSDVDAPFIMPDIQPYQSMATGEMITSRSRHREHLKANGLIEVGNETKYLQPKAVTPPAGRKEAIARAVYEKLRY